MPDQSLVSSAPLDSLLASLQPPVEEIEHLPLNLRLQAEIKAGHTKMSHVPPAAAQYLRLEASWVPEPYEAEAWTDAEMAAVGSGEKICPACYGNREVDRPYHGFLTGIRVTLPKKYHCIYFKLCYGKWMNPAIAPSDYRNVGLRNLLDYWRNLPTFAKNESSREGLQELISLVEKNPSSCFLLAGPAGSGKTTLMAAAYQRALDMWATRCFDEGLYANGVWKVNANVLSKQFRAVATRTDGRDDDTGVPTPTDVSENQVYAAINAGFVPRPFIDELDKFKIASDFQAQQFHTLIDAIQSNGVQAFAFSNLGLKAIAEALGPQYGPAIVRRLCGSRLDPDKPDNPGDPGKGGFFVDFWAGRIDKNYRFDTPKSENPKRQPSPGWLPMDQFKNKKQAERAGETAIQPNQHMLVEAMTGCAKDSVEPKRLTSTAATESGAALVVRLFEARVSSAGCSSLSLQLNDKIRAKRWKRGRVPCPT